jgi:hypothetical protein
MADNGRDRPFPHGIEIWTLYCFPRYFHSAHLDRAVGLLVRFRHLFLVGLFAAARDAVMPVHEYEVTRIHLGQYDPGR